MWKYISRLNLFILCRIYDEKTHSHTWDRVTKLEKGVIYYEGTVKMLQNLTGWRGHQVLYFGDHPYSDLAGKFPNVSSRSCTALKLFNFQMLPSSTGGELERLLTSLR